jgi:exopolyphosphatase/guanosine-5'-triphosphate,3'-diphosphate pyrophosphatase
MTDLDATFNDLDTRSVTKVAALDLGSNSFHLVVARIVSGSVQILHRVKQKVRMADGLDNDGILSEEAMQRGLDALVVMAESMQGFAPDSVRIVGTHTLRKAINAKTFIKAARNILPYPIEIISGPEEARLIYLGVAHTNHAEGQSLVVDIGGGSTEFVIGEGFNTKLLRSLQMGCVSYNLRFFKQGELKNKAFDKAITAAQQELELIERKYRLLGWQQVIGCSGTIKTIMDIVQQQSKKTSEQPITLSDLRQLIKQCCAFGHADKLNFEGLTEDRRYVFAAGLAILTAIFKSLEINEMLFSPAALREGVIYEMEERLTHTDIRQRTAESLATRYDVDTEQAKRVLATTQSLYEACKQNWDIRDNELKSMLGWAALLHEVGLQINSRGVQRHSAYILQFVDMPGFNQEQQNLLATLVRFQRKKIKLGEFTEFSQYSSEQIYKLVALLRMGILLNIKRQDEILPQMDVKADKKGWHLSFPQDWLEQKPIFIADLESEADYMQSLGMTLSYS